MLNKILLGLAAAISGILIPAHIFGGGVEFHLPILATDLAPDIKAVASIVWYAVTLILILNTALLVGAVLDKSWGRIAATIVALQYAGFAGLFVFYGVVRLGNLSQLPQWTAFLLIAILIAVSLRRGATQTSAT